MSRSEILDDFERDIQGWFIGMAIPHQPTLAEGVVGPIRSEKILKFNRKASRNSGKRKVEKVDSRYGGGEDTMIIKVGKPGSEERKIALAEQYAAILASGEELSPFGWDG